VSRAAPRQAAPDPLTEPGKYWYVYVLQSEANPCRFYTGTTDNLEGRLGRHNAGRSPHTARFRPWKLRVALAFPEKEKAAAFERYLKSHSGRAFAAKHF
jgi:putative endonuclease